MVFPFYQRKGYGKFLVAFSYELSRIDAKVGGPEKPLSDLGRNTYLSFWIQRIAEAVVDNRSKKLSIELISKQTAIAEDDIKWTLAKHKLIKYASGETFVNTEEFLGEVFQRVRKPTITIYRERIHYVPYRKSWEEG